MGDHDEPGKGGAASAVSQFTWEKYLNLSHLSISGGAGRTLQFPENPEVKVDSAISWHR